ncbi:MAG: 2-oxoacid:acceptor oxidoreductase subunit alpha [Pseudomonadota bacterium]
MKTDPPSSNQPSHSSSSSSSDALSAVIRFAGDSGDGIQLIGGHYSLQTAMQGHELVTFPDFPAEIRAPAGSTFGVSSFQIHFGGRDILTIGDQLDCLIAFNPAALKIHLDDLPVGATLIVDKGQFNTRNLKRAGFEDNPLNHLEQTYHLIDLDITSLTQKAVLSLRANNKQANRARNFWVLGLILWLYEQSRDNIHRWIAQKFNTQPLIRDINIAALNAGHIFGETSELSIALTTQKIQTKKRLPALYRNINGTNGFALGLAMASHLSKRKVIFCSYPITPASNLLHEVARMEAYNIQTFQAEDEIAAVTAALGASYAGSLGVTSSSGPGIALKGEAIGLGVMSELPLIIINAQRAGPSTGMPTKPEQSDLLQAVFGRNGESPIPVFAPARACECYDLTILAASVSMRLMVPVMILSDAYLANASEIWQIPDTKAFPPLFNLPKIDIKTPPQPYLRDPKNLSRPWITPGMKNGAHRIGGLEKSEPTGHISYDGDNHQKMIETRAKKIQQLSIDLEAPIVENGKKTGDLLVIGWGSTYGPISRAVENMNQKSVQTGHLHLRCLFPLHQHCQSIIKQFKHILVVEMNMGQLHLLLQAHFVRKMHAFKRPSGKPLNSAEIEAVIERLLSNSS